MATFAILLKFTPQGLREAKKSPERASQFRSNLESAGGKVRNVFWTQGAFDGLLVFEAPDEAVATAALLNLGKQGFVSTQSLRAFENAEFAKTLNKDT